MPSSSVLAPPMRRTNSPPSTSTLKLWLVIPPPSTVMRAARSGQRRSTAARAACVLNSAGSYLLLSPRIRRLALNSWGPLILPADPPAGQHGGRLRRAAQQVRSARHHQLPPDHRRPRQRLRALGC